VTTPNSVMAIRGTVFRISTSVDEAGEPITRISILEGEVSVQKKDENGNLTEEQSIVSGSEAIIYKEAEEVKIKVIDELSMNELPVEVLEFLQKLHREGNTIVLITHDNDIARKAQRIIRLADGCVIFDGPADDPRAVVTADESMKKEVDAS